MTQTASPRAWGQAGLLQDLLALDKSQQHRVVQGVQDALLHRAFCSCDFGYELCFPNDSMTDGSEAPLYF